VHNPVNDEDDVDPMECIICNDGRGLFGYDEERIQSASPDVRGLRPGVQGALAAPADDGDTGRNTNPASDALISKLDLKCLEIAERANELLNVSIPRTLKVALDSGAGDHVAAADQVGRKSIRPSAGSRNGRHFIAANGDRMANQGEAELNMVAPGGRTVKSTFQIADVTRALFSVSKMCDEGCEVHFTQTEAIVTKGGKVITRFAREGGLYCVEMQLKDEPINDGVAPFAGQGVKR
jgi:hypothetical protein